LEINFIRRKKMSQIFGENTGKGFIKEEPNDIFVKALESAIFKAPVRMDEKIFLSDLWIITSLPEDLMVNIIENHAEKLNIPQDINFILDDKKNKKIWERPVSERADKRQPKPASDEETK